MSVSAQARTQASASASAGMARRCTSSASAAGWKKAASPLRTKCPQSASQSSTAARSASSKTSGRTLPAKAMHSAVLNIARSSFSR